MVAAAIVGGAVVGGLGTAYAANSAANATQNATNATITEQRQALDQQAALSQPYRDLGSAALPQYEQLLGLTPGSNPDSIQKALEATPGYKFTQSQGETGILNAASLGGGVGGNTLAALDTFNTGLADSTYGSQVARIGQAVGTGQAAAAGQAQNVGTSAATIGNALTNQGNTTAGIDANLAAGLTKTIGNATDQYMTMDSLKALNTQVPATVST